MVPIVALSAGTKLPRCARYTINPGGMGDGVISIYNFENYLGSSEVEELWMLKRNEAANITCKNLQNIAVDSATWGSCPK